MSYQVLALKYRPQTFSDVVGQSHVTTTLTNAIQQDRVAHAILFTGPRGTGKTTIARILAKALNCRTGPTPTPCNTCKICQEIIQGHCSDVFEIDGASNNSVDQIRDLRENVTYMPASAPYKIYIIDEVHMLSTAAFNALLKTLEEPPSHVVFIFATTEVHKIPATILSRCQRHDLGRIPLEQIAAHLNKLSQEEGFTVDSQGFDLIAMEADGSIRDSLSLMDRVLSSADSDAVSYQQVVDGLGVLDRQLMYDIAEAVFTKNGAALISLVETANDSGLDLKKFYSDTILHFRNLNVIKLCGAENAAVNLTDTEKRKMADLVAPLSDSYLGTLLQLLLTDESMVKFSSHTKTAVEMVLLKLLQINPGAQLDTIIQKLDRLARQIDERIAKGEPLRSPAPGISGDRATPPAPAMPPVQATPRAPHPPSGQPIHPAPTTQVPPPPAPEPTGPAPQPGPGAPPAGAYPESVPPPEPPPGYGAPDTPEHPKTWQGFLSLMDKKQPFIVALLSKARITEPGPGRILAELHNCSAFDKTRLSSKKDSLQKECKAFLGKTLELDIVSGSTPMTSPDEKRANLQAKQAAFNHPLVMDAKRIFNGDILI